MACILLPLRQVLPVSEVVAPRGRVICFPNPPFHMKSLGIVPKLTAVTLKRLWDNKRKY
jgi:hypothetical protein